MLGRKKRNSRVVDIANPGQTTQSASDEQAKKQISTSTSRKSAFRSIFFCFGSGNESSRSEENTALMPKK